ncbi:Ninjurin-1 [Habropoda laboriosa]|uniref:Ninjurin-1 n=1 Tax=Habropoda laboriosa TaxID=597456 RepID=A0A0L7RIB2_9HYME|nr:PREDICTED: ninjurin-1 [Habropoda laboriosa]KOC70605.1 Ninjurin-1 [Habropoda laboriosa]
MIQPKDDNEEIIYMDDVADDALKPLTSQPLETIRIEPRLGSMLETDNTNNPKPTSGPEIDDLEPDEKPSIGFDIRGIDDGLLPSAPRTPEVSSFPDSRMPVPFFPVPPLESIPDVNVYQHKKTLAQGMMDLALLSANANQLRYVLQTDGGHPYYYPSLVMIGASLFLQIAVGIGLIWNSRYNVKDDAQMCKAEKANNLTVIGIFLVTILNVFISSFGVVDQVTTIPAPT